ncbi:MFS transporter [bacterium]|nr:MFS transporter [bacterium]
MHRPPSLRTARLAVSTSFFVSGAVLASWVPHIPAMQRALDLSPGLLGLVLLSPALGAVIAMLVSGGLCARWGHARVNRGATFLYCCAVPLTVLAPHPILLACVLVVMGFNNGTLGVAMNAEAIEVERAYGRLINSSFHALYGLGLLVGASAGGLVIGMGGSPLAHLLVAAALLGFLGVGASFRYLSDAPSKAAGGRAPLFVRPTRFLLLLGIGTFSCSLIEGAMADWAGIYLRDVRGAAPGLAAMGFAAYSFAMTLSRFAGDSLNQQLGKRGLVRLGGFLGVAGVALALGVRHPLAAVAGFGLVGLGMANVVPNFFSDAAREPSMPPSRAIAAVSSLGYAGILMGPPIIGAVAQLTSLSAAMGVVAVSSALVWALAGNLSGRPVLTRSLSAG